MWGVIKIATLPFWGPPYLVGKTVLESSRFIQGKIGRGKVENTYSHGDARIATPADIKREGHLPYHNGGVFIGQTDVPRLFGKTKMSIYSHEDDGVCIFGGRGAGKSRFISSDIFQMEFWPKSKPRTDIIVLDAAGEFEGLHRAELERLGYNVILITLEDPKMGMKIDPLASLDKDSATFEIDTEAFCLSVIPKTGDPRNEHFSDVPRGLLAGAISYYLHKKPDTPLIDILQSIFKSRDGLKAETEKWQELKGDYSVLNALTLAETIGKNEYGSFISTMKVALRPFQTRHWCKLTERNPDSWNFTKMYRGDQPTAVFIRTMGDQSTVGPQVRMLINNAVRERINLGRYIKDRPRGKIAFKRPLRIYIDEAVNLGNSEGVKRGQNELRKAGVTLVMAWLDHNEMSHTYRDSPSFMSGWTQIFSSGITHYGTLQYISQMFGQGTYIGETTSQNDYGQSRSYHEYGGKVLQPDAVRRVTEDEWLVLTRRLSIRCWKTSVERNGHILYG
ncbi:type IV secretory system conjugative DNA transfer family protein [Methylopila sp. 73B]|uniref:type IV secretory system conjugative DNA transfer family protein n=1 Tax=Methylopila sp. 73B TaxID=1120792 RepID=UPI0003A11A6F|nr:type IV secretory system conjugative DNA transfer family protein [Methylopila sp. 73B]